MTTRYELFDHLDHGAIMVPHSDGGWVPYTEYARVLEKSERLKKHNQTIAGFIRQRNYEIAQVNRKLHEAYEKLSSKGGDNAPANASV